MICTAAVFAAIIKNFIPSEKFGRPMHLLLAAFALLTVIAPIKKFSSELPELYDPSGMDTGYTEKAEQIISRQTSSQLQQQLRLRGFDVACVEADAKIGAETGIYVQSVRIDITEKEKHRAQELAALIEDETGLVPEIDVVSGDG